MKLNYLLDISNESTWKINTPDSIAKRLPFYINECGHFIANAGYFTEREGQDNYLLLYTIAGNGYLKYMRDEYILKPGQTAVIYCAYYQYYKTFTDEPWNFKWVHFNGTAASEYYKLLNGDLLNMVCINHLTRFEKMLDDLNKYIQVNDIASNIKISSLITDILSELIISKFNPLNNKKSQQHRTEINKVVSYIEQNYKKKITLDHLVKVAHVSKYHFSRVFKSHMGLSPYEYLIHFRINKAKELLKGTQLTVDEIADVVGFCDTNNFIRKFKEIVGATPFTYKKYNIFG